MAVKSQIGNVCKGSSAMSQGIVCLAQNNTTTDYVRLAYLQRLSLRVSNPQLPYALVTDQHSADSLTSKQRDAFDHVIVLANDQAADQEWKQRNDAQLFFHSPFRETIKVEADLLFTRNIQHWWPVLQHRDVVLSLGCVNHKGEPSTKRNYRRVFDLNNLPDIYSGLMYWRRSNTAHALFSQVAALHQNWPQVQKALVACDDPGSNDVIFSLAAMIMGCEVCTLPAADFFRMAHLKPTHVGLPEGQRWHNKYNVEVEPPELRINGLVQWHPVHYVDKTWPTDQIIERFELCCLN
jgi:hypothetical protein